MNSNSMEHVQEQHFSFNSRMGSSPATKPATKPLKQVTDNKLHLSTFSCIRGTSYEKRAAHC